jgi:hypothetical protein
MFLDSGSRLGWPNFRLPRPPRIRVAVGMPGVIIAVGLLIVIILAFPQPAPQPAPDVPAQLPALVHHEPVNRGLLYIDTRR